MLLTPAARWSIEKGAPSRAADDPSDKEPKWTAMFRWRRKKRLGALHAVHDHADDRRDDRAGYAATNQLADKRADIHAARRAGQHWDKGGQERSAGRAAQSASDCVARGSEVHILCRRADRIAADRASNELDDKIDNRARHGVPYVMAAKSRGAAAIFALRSIMLPRFCSILVTSQSSSRSLRNTIARFRNRDVASRELPPERA